MIQIEAKALKAALAGVTTVIERRNTIPLLANVLIVASKKGATLTGTDLDLWIERQVVGEGRTPFSTTVDAHMLAAIVGKLPADDPVTLVLKDGKLAVSSGRSRFSLPTLPIDDFPSLPVIERATQFAMTGEQILEGFATVGFAQGAEPTRYYLSGIFWHVVADPPELRMAATDGHRLARIGFDAPDGAAGMPDIILPTKAAAVLTRLLDKRGEETVELMLTGMRGRFRIGDDVLSIKLVDGTFPDYTRVIPTGNDKLMRCDPRALEAAVSRVAVISTEKVRTLKLELTGNTARLSVTSAEHGTATEELPVDYSAGPLTVGLNSRYLLDVLGRLHGETIELHLADSAAPVLVRESDKAAATFVVMPMRV